MLRANVAQTTRQHNRLVVSEHAPTNVRLKCAKVPTQIRPPKLVVERRRSQWPFCHDLQCRSYVRGPSILALPRLRRLRQIQIRNRKPAQPRLRLRSTSRSALIANLTTRTRRGSRPRRNRRWMIVRLHLQQNRNLFCRVCIFARLRIRKKSSTVRSANHSGIIAIRREHILSATLIRVANHLKQRPFLLHAVDGPRCIENFMPAMLAVRLRKHVQLHVRRVAAQLRKLTDQVINLVRC